MHKKDIGIRWDDLPSIGAKCGANGYVYPKDNPLVIGGLRSWLEVISQHVNQGKEVPEEFRGVREGVDKKEESEAGEKVREEL